VLLCPHQGAPRLPSLVASAASASPAGSAIAAPFDLAQHVVSYTIIRTIAPQNTVSSGESGFSMVEAWNQLRGL
jgi:hypothetical protein